MSKEHEVTKSMLNTIRDKNSKGIKLLREEEAIDLNSAEAKNEEKSFMSLVSPRTTFKTFKIYPNANNVVFSGAFDNGIEWQLSKLDGLYFNAPNMELTDEVMDLLKKLSGYYVKWSKEWAEKLNLEYKGDNDAEEDI